MTHCQRVLNLLSDGKPHTHHELYALNVIAHSRVADLRRQGHQIACWTANDNGERVSVYQLLPSLGERSQHGILPDALTSSPSAAPDPGGNRVELRSPRQMSVFEAA